jgi:hypothetical protein
VSFLGLVWAVFLLWLPAGAAVGAVPAPLLLLALPEREGPLLALALVLVNLLEWPVLLSVVFLGLWLTIPLRTLLFLIMVVEFWKAVHLSKSPSLNPTLLGE